MDNLASYDQFFEAATGHLPFPYQRRLAETEHFPHLLRVETGCCKVGRSARILYFAWRRSGAVRM